MSLDVYLIMPGATVPAGSGIFIRERGAQREISRAEWDERYPGREPVRVLQDGETDTVYHGNITHNLGPMALRAELYGPLWRPDEIGIMRAEQLIEHLEKGLVKLRRYPSLFRRYDPENGWGTYEGLVEFVEEYLAACRRWPHATVSVSR